MAKTYRFVFAIIVVLFLITGCHKHTFADAYSYDDVYHWHESTCGHDNAIKKEPHSFGSWTQSPISLIYSLNSRTCNACGYIEYDDNFFKEVFIEYDSLKREFGDNLDNNQFKEHFGEKEKEKIYFLKDLGSYPLPFLNIPDSYETIGSVRYRYGSIQSDLEAYLSGKTPFSYDLDAFYPVIEINIPKSTKSIEIDFFEPFYCLERINVSVNNQKYYSENGALFEKDLNGNKTIVLVPCNNNTFKDIPTDVKYIGERAFYCNEHLETIVIPLGVESIGISAFSDCIGLTNITIPNSVTTIGEGAFSGCSGLTSITIPNSVTTIDRMIFSGCSGLTNITIPNSVTTIGEGAFLGCSGLTNITIPNSVTTIEFGVFFYCDNLTDISFSGTKNQWYNMQLEDGWNYGVPATVVHCSDGDVLLNQ